MYTPHMHDHTWMTTTSSPTLVQKYKNKGEMLAAAGLSLKADTAEMMQQIVALQQQLADAQQQQQAAEQVRRCEETVRMMMLITESSVFLQQHHAFLSRQ